MANTNALVFMAISLSSQQGLASTSAISNAADYINRSILTDIEIKESISWLDKQGLIFQKEALVGLSDKGKGIYELATQNSKILHKILDYLKREMRNYA